MKKILLMTALFTMLGVSAQAGTLDVPHGYVSNTAPATNGVEKSTWNTPSLDGIYISGSAGIAIARDSSVTSSSPAADGKGKYDSAASYALAIGKHVTPHLRAEVEMSYRKADVKLTINGAPGVVIPGDDATWTALANVYYDFLPTEKISPYIGAGIGAARHSAELTGGGFNVDDSDTGLAWQTGAGAKVNIAHNVDFTLGYRYLSTSDMKFNTVSADYGVNEIRAGFVYSLKP